MPTTSTRWASREAAYAPAKVPFYGIILGKEAMPLGRIQHDITFGQLDNFRKEPLTF
jgi:hypothetical protein